jgi:hypothetical protein
MQAASVGEVWGIRLAARKANWETHPHTVHSNVIDAGGNQRMPTLLCFVSGTRGFL